MEARRVAIIATGSEADASYAPAVPPHECGMEDEDKEGNERRNEDNDDTDPKEHDHEHHEPDPESDMAHARYGTCPHCDQSFTCVPTADDNWVDTFAA